MSREDDDPLLGRLLVQQNELLQRLGEPRQTVYVEAARARERSSEPRSPGRVGDDCGALIREISHSLNTPLSLIEATVIGYEKPGEMPADGLRRIKSSVEVCKAFLVSFRSLINVAESAADWNANSLREALEAAAAVYLGAMDKQDVVASVEIDDEVEGYSNSFVLATLLPLIENAVEAAPAGAEIIVRADRSVASEGTVITVVNASDGRTFGDEIYGAGYTTKDGHEGLGLTVVKRLVGTVPGAKLECSRSGDSVTFAVFLPRRGI
jgi:K+-sensing histidine kinase KdpD